MLQQFASMSNTEMVTVLLKIGSQKLPFGLLRAT